MSFRPIYEIKMKIGDKDYTDGVESVAIISAIGSVYQIFHIKFRIDEVKETVDKIFGSDYITLEIIETAEDQTTYNVMKLELVNLTNSFSQENRINIPDMENKMVNAVNQEIELLCIPRKALECMLSITNLVVPESNHYYPLYIAYALVFNFLRGKYDKINWIAENKNPTPVEQALIPPLPFSSAIDLIDTQFGIYKGPVHHQARMEKDLLVLDMWDLSYMMNRDPFYTINILNLGKEDREVYARVKLQGSNKEIEIHNPLHFNYIGNQQLLQEAFNNIFISKPMDDLYYRIDVNMQDIFLNNSVRDGGRLEYNPSTKQRTRVYNRWNLGMRDDDTYARSFLSRKLSDVNKIRVNLGRNIALSRLIGVGIPINLNYEGEVYKPHEGKYIVNRSLFVMSKEGQVHFTGATEIEIFRANVFNK